MNSPQIQTIFYAVNRALWLAELAAALDAAMRVTVEIERQGGRDDDSHHLREQISIARCEVDSLRKRRGEMVRTKHPYWVK